MFTKLFTVPPILSQAILSCDVTTTLRTNEGDSRRPIAAAIITVSTYMLAQRNVALLYFLRQKSI